MVTGQGSSSPAAHDFGRALRLWLIRPQCAAARRESGKQHTESVTRLESTTAGRRPTREPSSRTAQIGTRRTTAARALTFGEASSLKLDVGRPARALGLTGTRLSRRLPVEGNDAAKLPCPESPVHV